MEIDVTPADFGRVAAQTAKQVIRQKLQDVEKGKIYDDYIEKECNEEREDEEMGRRKFVENMDELVKEGKKKYVRYAEGAELYSMGLHTFQSLAKEAKATRKVKGVVHCNTEKIDAFIESFLE